MIVLKTLQQAFHTYEIPDALFTDFAIWLAKHDPRCQAYKVEIDFINEIVAHANREPDRPRDDSGQDNCTTPSKGSNNGTGKVR